MEEKKKTATIMIRELKKLFPEAKTALHHSSAWELLVATILSAQCTDKLVNKVTENLFKKYKTLDDYVNASVEEFDQDIKSVTFHGNKSKNILKTAKIVKETYGGKVPDTMEDLISLPGVARKTANVVLGVWFHKSEGVVVDTHVRRLTQLHGLTTNEDPVKIEKDLMEIIPKDEWTDFSLRLILYGREYCSARPHDHAKCPLVRALA
jgi:endonuclease III